MSSSAANEVATLVVRHWRLLSPLPRLLVTLLIRLFRLRCRLTTGRPFRALPPAHRRLLLRRQRGEFPLNRLLSLIDPLVAIARWRDPLPPPPPPDMRDQASWRSSECEVVVIGSGPGGALCAMLLAEAGIDTLLLEEGGHQKDRSLPAHSAYHLASQLRHGGISLTIGTPPIPYIEGRSLGGASEINSGLHLPPDQRVVAQWQRQFGFDPADLDRAIDANRILLEVLPPDPAALSVASRLLAAGAERLGWSWIELEQWRDHSAIWSDHLRDRYHTVTTHLLPRLQAAGGRIATGRRAERISRDGAKWRVEGRHWRVSADQVVVAGGAIQGPALLQRSSLGRGVGRSVSLQLTLKVVARFNHPVNAPDLGMGSCQVDHFAPSMRLGCAISTQPQLAIALRHHPQIRARLNHLYPNLLCYALTLSASGRGRLRRLPFGDSQLLYRLDEDDWLALALGLQRLCRLLLAAGATHLYPDIAPAIELDDEAGLARLPESLRRHQPGLQSLHLAGGCAMGGDPLLCPVDNRGALRGHPGVWVADASLLPTNPGGNPQAAVMALARRAAVSIISERIAQ